MKALSRALLLAAVLLFCALFAQRAHGFWIFTLDDAYITLRYAKHLAATLEPAWNVGGAPVEGYTSVMWLVVLALGEALGCDGVLFAKGAGIAFALAASGCAAKFASELNAGEDRRGRVVAASAALVMAAAYWPWPLHAVSGMETSLSGLSLLLLFWQSVRVQRVPAPPLASAGLACCGLIATLTRPEAGLVSAVCVGLCLLRLPREARGGLARAVLYGALLPGALYFGWRLWRYRLLLPLSFYVKSTGQEPLAGLEDVVQFCVAFVRDQPLWGALAVFGALGRRVLWPALAAAAALLVFFVFPAHIMAFEGRYLMPLFPLLCALAGAGAGRAADWALARVEARAPQVTARRGAAAFAALGAALLALAAWAFPADLANRSLRWLAYGQGLQSAHVALASAMARSQGAPRSIALLDVGAIGYVADWETIDTFGLNEPHVALTRRSDPGYVLEQRPDLLVVVSSQRDRYEPLFDWELPLYQGAEARGYEFACSYRFDDEYFLWVLARAHAGVASACPAR